MLYERTTAEELQQFVRVEHDLKKKLGLRLLTKVNKGRIRKMCGLDSKPFF